MNSSTTRNQTSIELGDTVPTVTITREFDAPVAHLFRAWTDGDLVARWMGPRSQTMHIERYDCTTGGAWRWWSSGEDGVEHHFYGSFHDVRRNDRLVQTFSYEGFPDSVALEILHLEALDGGRCRLTSVSVGASVEGRDAMVASGMERGVVEGYQKLDTLLAGG